MTSGGRRGAITDLLTTSRHPFRSFDTLRDSAARRQVQSLILSSHRFLWPPLLLPPLTVPGMIVFERPEDLETWPYDFSFLLLTVVSKSSYAPMARSILLRTSTFVMCSVYDMLRNFREHLISIACIRRCRSAVSVQLSHAYRKIDITSERNRRIFYLRVMFRSLQIFFRLDKAAVA